MRRRAERPGLSTKSSCHGSARAKRTACHLAEHVRPYFTGHIFEYADTRPTALKKHSPAGQSASWPSICGTTSPVREDRAGGPALSPPPLRDFLVTHQDLEGVPEPEFRHQARPDRVRAHRATGPDVRSGRVRPARHPPDRGIALAPRSDPDRLPATYRRTQGITYCHGCYSVGDNQLWNVVRRRKGIDHTWAALRSIRATCRSASRST